MLACFFYQMEPGGIHTIAKHFIMSELTEM